jgi:predicted PurR-regulated permease PerM
MWGVIGALLAFPLLAVVKIVCDRIPPLMPLGHLLGGPPRPARPGGTRPVTG